MTVLLDKIVPVTVALVFFVGIAVGVVGALLMAAFDRELWTLVVFWAGFGPFIAMVMLWAVGGMLYLGFAFAYDVLRGNV